MCRLRTTDEDSRRHRNRCDLFLAAQAAAQTDNPKDKPATPDWITTTNKPARFGIRILNRTNP
jgi:hypothetical protein